MRKKAITSPQSTRKLLNEPNNYDTFGIQVVESEPESP